MLFSGIFVAGVIRRAFNGGAEFLGANVDEEVDQDTKNQGASDFGQSDVADGKFQTTDARDKDNGDDEQVAVIAKVGGLNHLKTADGDETIKRDADATHDTVWNRGQEGGERRDEGEDDGKKRRDDNRADGGIARDGDGTDGFTIGRVGAAAEEGASHRTNAIAKKRAVETRIFKQVVADDGAEVLVVGDVLGKDDEGDRDIAHDKAAEVSEEITWIGEIFKAVERLDESEAREPFHGGEFREIDYF